MPNFLNILASLIQSNYLLSYFLIYLAVIFLGNLVSFFVFWIIIAGKLHPINILGVLFLTYLGDISGDILWFNLGRFLRGTKIGKFVLKKAPVQNGKFEELIKQSGIRWFGYSKFFYGSSPIFAFSLGWVGIVFDKFLKTTALLTLIWIPVFFAISFSLILGLIPLSSISLFKKMEWLFILGLILFIIIERLLVYLTKRVFLIKLNKDEK